MAFNFCLTIVRRIYKCFWDLRAFFRASQKRYNQCRVPSLFIKKRHRVSTSRPINYSENYFLFVPKGNTWDKRSNRKIALGKFLVSPLELVKTPELPDKCQMLSFLKGAVVARAWESWWARALACWVVGNRWAFSDSETLAALEVSPVENNNNNKLLSASWHIQNPSRLEASWDQQAYKFWGV